jgi:hypothetical protein
MILQLLHWRLGSRICSENTSLLRVIFYPTLLVFLTTLQCVACIRLWFIGPCHAQQRRRSRAQIQHEGGSRVLYPDHAEGAWLPSVPYAPFLRSR